MDATRLAAACAKIDEYAAVGAPMSGAKIAAICAIIEDGATARKHRRKKRRRRLCVDSTRSYKQIGEVGIGNFGAVILARHRKTGQAVAIKTFRGRDGKKSPDVGEVLREACFLAASAGHPNLVGLHTVARRPGTKEYFVVMEFVGPSLRHALNKHLRIHDAPFPEADVRRIMRHILTGAQAMHSLCIVHRDTKPVNILVKEDGRVVKICDYGLAISDYDERVDLWSIGCVMAELLSGKVLFKVENGVRQIDKIFDLLGAPAEETFETFMSPFMCGKVLRRRARLPPPRRDSRLRELLPSDVLSEDGYGVLKGLLTCNPKERLTAATALQLPWFIGTAGVP
ncbi:Cyclin-dependent kinase G-1 [Zea mays]|uniref:Cyclin-dependent kinase G-1 n=1 Tax=Zea mays TaxID=4577 RepID=A0A1D6I5E7_MAIZE|nr:Cyclin-dependent kinase G-1 [Zea mays]